MANAVNAGILRWNTPTKAIAGCVALISVAAIVGGVVAAILTSGIALKTALLVSGTVVFVVDMMFVFFAKRAQYRHDHKKRLFDLNLVENPPKVPQIDTMKLLKKAGSKNITLDAQEKKAIKVVISNWDYACQRRPRKNLWSLSELYTALGVEAQFAYAPDLLVAEMLRQFEVPIKNGRISTDYINDLVGQMQDKFHI